VDGVASEDVLTTDAVEVVEAFVRKEVLVIDEIELVAVGDGKLEV
jgi:hypothetical protein